MKPISGARTTTSCWTSRATRRARRSSAPTAGARHLGRGLARDLLALQRGRARRDARARSSTPTACSRTPSARRAYDEPGRLRAADELAPRPRAWTSRSRSRGRRCCPRSTPSRIARGRRRPYDGARLRRNAPPARHRARPDRAHHEDEPDLPPLPRGGALRARCRRAVYVRGFVTRVRALPRARPGARRDGLHGALRGRRGRESARQGAVAAVAGSERAWSGSRIPSGRRASRARSSRT